MNVAKTALIIVLVLLSTGIAAASRPRLIIAGFGVEDGSAVVGQNFTLSAQVKNVNDVCALVTTMRVEPSEPFLLQGVSTTLPVSICGGETKSISIPLTVDPSGTAGSYPLTVTLNYEDFLASPYTDATTISILVQGAPDLSASVVKSNPVDVYAGDTATITVRLQNDGTFEAQAVHASLSAGSPLEVDWANNALSVGKLDARASTTADFSIDVPKDARAQSYPVNLTVSYLDQNRQDRVKTFPFLFVVKKKALFAATDAGSELFFANDNTKTVRITLKNIGTDAARHLTARILPQYPFTTDGSVRYVDTIPAGGSAPVEFTVNIDKDAAVGTYGLEVLLNFEDAQGKTLQDSTKMALTVQKKGVLRAVFLDYWYLWAIAIIIAFIVVRKKSSKPKK